MAALLPDGGPTIGTCACTCDDCWTQIVKPIRHPSERWKRFSTAERLIIHFDLGAILVAEAKSEEPKSKMDPSVRWDDVGEFNRTRRIQMMRGEFEFRELKKNPGRSIPSA